MTAPKTPETSIDDALACVAAEEVIWVRVAATQGQGNAGLEQTMLDLVSGAPPPSWEPLYWRYPSALFIASEQRGSVVARWLRERLIRLYGAFIELPEINTPSDGNGVTAWQPGVHTSPLPWPTMTASCSTSRHVARRTRSASSLRTALPAFDTYYTAASYVFNTAKPIGGGRGLAAPMYRHQDTTARINRVQIVEHSEIVRVELEGSCLDESMVELGGDVPGPTLPLAKELLPNVDIPIPNGLPNDAWVLVRNRGVWLDRRFLSRQYPRADQPGVEFVVEPTTRLQSFIASREGPQVEFKEGVPSDSNKEIFRVAKTVSAFANESGGILLFGVDDDEEVVGVPSSGLDGTKNRLTSLMSSWVDPRPTITFEEFPIEGDPSD